MSFPWRIQGFHRRILGQHCREVKIAAERGIHILCEKPMAPTIKDCEEMIEACQRNGVKLMIGFKKRFAPVCVALKERIKEQLGNPYWLSISSRRKGVVLG